MTEISKLRERHWSCEDKKLYIILLLFGARSISFVYCRIQYLFFALIFFYSWSFFLIPHENFVFPEFFLSALLFKTRILIFFLFLSLQWLVMKIRYAILKRKSIYKFEMILPYVFFDTKTKIVFIICFRHIMILLLYLHLSHFYPLSFYYLSVLIFYSNNFNVWNLIQNCIMFLISSFTKYFFCNSLRVEMKFLNRFLLRAVPNTWYIWKYDNILWAKKIAYAFGYLEVKIWIVDVSLVINEEI